jgi:hypothetical protein
MSPPSDGSLRHIDLSPRSSCSWFDPTITVSRSGIVESVYRFAPEVARGTRAIRTCVPSQRCAIPSLRGGLSRRVHRGGVRLVGQRRRDRRRRWIAGGLVGSEQRFELQIERIFDLVGVELGIRRLERVVRVQRRSRHLLPIGDRQRLHMRGRSVPHRRGRRNAL